jgi:hypothetical protein
MNRQSLKAQPLVAQHLLLLPKVLQTEFGLMPNSQPEVPQRHPATGLKTDLRLSIPKSSSTTHASFEI